MTGRGRFSHCSDEYREKSDRYNSLAELPNFILTHQHDRKVSVTVRMNARKKSDRYNSPADLHNYILPHQHDRKGTFQSVF